MFHRLCPKCMNMIPLMLKQIRFPCPLLDNKGVCPYGQMMINKDKKKYIKQSKTCYVRYTT